MTRLTLSKAFSALLLIATTTMSVVQAQNTYPIVLVHGFAGWGRDELLGFKYWGAIQGDLQEQLVAQGYTVYTASIGPFSSNWDRACELYAQIKGGQVDYGTKHSAKYGHERYGRNYTGLYPEWGETNSDGSVKKIHLLGHSMGGQTIRMLTQMLEKGTTGAPVEEDSSSHPLFAGGKSWVHSISTFATPNKGTTLADGLSQIGDTVKNLLVSVLNVIGIAGDEADLIYDAQLEQWGITDKQDGESLSTYLKRVFSSSIFDEGFEDVCLYSLSTTGAKEESTWVETLSDVYYYSYATIDTFETINWKLQKISYPNVLTMLLPLDVTSIFVGGRYTVDTLGFSTDWQPNDGVVNTISQSQDYVGSLVKYAGTSYKGKWNSMTQLTGLDHEAVTGLTLFNEVYDIYLAHATLLYSLPADTGSRRLTAEDSATAAALALLANASVTAAITSLNAATSSVSTVSDLETLCANPATTYAATYCTNLLSSTVVAANSTGGNTTTAILESSSTRRLRGTN
jgi:triacylglycerol lipase